METKFGSPVAACQSGQRVECVLVTVSVVAVTEYLAMVARGRRRLFGGCCSKRQDPSWRKRCSKKNRKEAEEWAVSFNLLSVHPRPQPVEQ